MPRKLRRHFVKRHLSSAAPRSASDACPGIETRCSIGNRFAQAGPTVESWTLRPDEQSHRPGERRQRCRWGRRGSEERCETSGRRHLGASREAQGENAAPLEEAICGRASPDRRVSLVPPERHYAATSRRAASMARVKDAPYIPWVRSHHRARPGWESIRAMTGSWVSRSSGCIAPASTRACNPCVA